MGSSGEESKTGKGRIVYDLQRNNCVKQRDRGIKVHVQAGAGQCTCLAVPFAQSELSVLSSH